MYPTVYLHKMTLYLPEIIFTNEIEDSQLF